MTDTKKAFLSYSHEDKVFAETIARALRSNGIEVWFDEWEIKAGDSLVQKIFAEGLRDCDIFLVVLSEISVRSNWVRHELDAAMVKKIEGITRIIPLIKEKCDIPLPLKALLWVDLSSDFDGGIDRILHAAFDVVVRPPLGPVPNYITGLRESVGGLSKLATTVASALLAGGDDDRGNEAVYSGPELKALLPILTEQQIDDAIVELEEYGLVQAMKWMGTAPYGFGQVEPTYALYLHFRGTSLLEYDPEQDIKMVAAAAAPVEQTTGTELQEATHLTPLRINRAVNYLEDYGIAEIVRHSGTAPFDFGVLMSSRKTRQFVAEASHVRSR